MLIPYFGEKSRFADFIVPNIPTDISTYVELFSGMFGIFFSLNFSKYKNVKFIYNDINKLNYFLFKNLKDPIFIEEVKLTQVNKDYYKKCLINLFLEKDEKIVSLYWLVILCCSKTYEIGKDSYKGDSEFEIFKLKYKAYKNLLDKISNIQNLDYIDAINLYDSNDTFFYIDPPYYGKEKFHINHNFISEDSHIELSNSLKLIKGKFALSYYWFNGLDNLYQGYNIKKKKTITGMEYLIMNY